MPAFLIPVVMWVVQFLRDKSFALTMVGVFVALVGTYLAALAAVVGFVATSAPAVVVEAMSVLLPSQWPLQFATIASIYSLGIAYRVGLQSVVIFSKG